LLLKFFDVSQISTIYLLTLLRAAFAKITFLKTPTSRSGNSERYLLCQGYNHSFQQIGYDELLHYVKKGESLGEELKKWIGKVNFPHLQSHILDHMNQTWIQQTQTLKQIIAHCLEVKHDDLFVPISMGPCLEKISEFWNKWHFAWFHGLTKEIPCKYFQMDQKQVIGTDLPLFDNWDQLHHDTRYLSLLEPFLRTSNLTSNTRLVYVSKNQLYDLNLQSIIPTSKTLSSLSRYPSNTLVVLSDDKIQNILALPKYPKIFLKDHKEKATKWKLLTGNLEWWS